MIKKQAAMLAVCAALLLCVVAAGCSGPAASPTPSTVKNASTGNTTTKAAASSEAGTPTATSTETPTATPTSSAESTPTSSPSAGGSAGMSVLFYYLPGCPHCAALENSSSFAQLQSTVSVTWVIYEGPNNYGVTEAPTLVLLNNGVKVGIWPGVEDASGILAQINAG